MLPQDLTMAVADLTFFATAEAPYRDAKCDKKKKPRLAPSPRRVYLTNFLAPRARKVLK